MLAHRQAVGWIVIAVMVSILLALIVFGPVFSVRAHAATVCMASWYQRGTLTASGERFRPDGLTVAMRSRAFGRRLRITHLGNGRSVVVRLTDYGPARWTGRCADLSRGAARALGMIRAGTARVRIEVLR